MGTEETLIIIIYYTPPLQSPVHSMWLARSISREFVHCVVYTRSQLAAIRCSSSFPIIPSGKSPSLLQPPTTSNCSPIPITVVARSNDDDENIYSVLEKASDWAMRVSIIYCCAMGLPPSRPIKHSERIWSVKKERKNNNNNHRLLLLLLVLNNKVGAVQRHNWSSSSNWISQSVNVLFPSASAWEDLV